MQDRNLRVQLGEPRAGVGSVTVPIDTAASPLEPLAVWFVARGLAE